MKAGTSIAPAAANTANNTANSGNNTAQPQNGQGGNNGQTYYNPPANICPVQQCSSTVNEGPANSNGQGPNFYTVNFKYSGNTPPPPPPGMHYLASNMTGCGGGTCTLFLEFNSPTASTTTSTPVTVPPPTAGGRQPIYVQDANGVWHYSYWFAPPADVLGNYGPLSEASSQPVLPYGFNYANGPPPNAVYGDDVTGKQQASNDQQSGDNNGKQPGDASGKNGNIQEASAGPSANQQTAASDQGCCAPDSDADRANMQKYGTADANYLRMLQDIGQAPPEDPNIPKAPVALSVNPGQPANDGAGGRTAVSETSSATSANEGYSRESLSQDVDVIGATAGLTGHETTSSASDVFTGGNALYNAVNEGPTGFGVADLIEGGGKLIQAAGNLGGGLKLPIAGFTSYEAAAIKTGAYLSTSSGGAADPRFLGLTADGWGAIASGSTAGARFFGGVAAMEAGSATGPSGMAIAFGKGSEAVGNLITFGNYLLEPVVQPMVNYFIPLPTEVPPDYRAIPRTLPSAGALPTHP
jgi:hypothetical protein